MGINNLSKVVKAKEAIKYANLRDFLVTRMDTPKEPMIAVDAYNLIYRATTWKNAFKLTNASVLKEGDQEQSTAHIKVILAFIKRMRTLDIKHVWVFDHQSSNEEGFHLPMKEECLKKRHKAKEAACQKMNEEQSEEKMLALKRQAFTMNSKTAQEVQKILTDCEVPWIVAPKGCEGEQICAQLTLDKNGAPCQAVLSDDMDCLVYGAPCLLRNVSQKNRKTVGGDLTAYYDVLQSLDEIYKAKAKNPDKGPFSQQKFIKMAVMMGSDLIEKTKGVGPTTVFKKIDELQLTEGQLKAAEHFEMDCEVPPIVTQPSDPEGLVEWLVAKKGFDKKKLGWILQRGFE